MNEDVAYARNVKAGVKGLRNLKSIVPRVEWTIKYQKV